MSLGIVDRVVQRFDDFKFRVTQRRATFQPRTNRVISYRNPTNSQEKRAIPAFGVEAGAFGLDWAADAPVHYRGGSVPRPILRNIHGHVSENSQPLIGPTEVYMDPAISPRGSRTSESTDQRPVGVGHGTSPIDKPVTLNHQIRKSFESDTGKNPRTPTLADQAAEDLKHYDFDFSI